jgi:hypothetical protein
MAKLFRQMQLWCILFAFLQCLYYRDAAVACPKPSLMAQNSFRVLLISFCIDMVAFFGKGTQTKVLEEILYITKPLNY